MSQNGLFPQIMQPGAGFLLHEGFISGFAAPNCAFYILFVFNQVTMPPKKNSRYYSLPKEDSTLRRSIGKSNAMITTPMKSLMRIKSMHRQMSEIKKLNILVEQKPSISLKTVPLNSFEPAEKSPLLPNKQRGYLITKRKKLKQLRIGFQKRHSRFTMTDEQRLLPEHSQIEDYKFITSSGLRDYNEDRICIKETLKIDQQQYSFFAVFDGHGGSSAAQYLKIHFISIFELQAKKQSIKQALFNTVKEVEIKILQAGTKINSGSTALVCVIRQNEYWIANVGDSRAVLIRENGDYVQLTVDHKPETESERKRIEECGGKIYRSVTVNRNTGQKIYGPARILPGKLSVSRTIGDSWTKKSQQNKQILISTPDLYSGILNPNETIILMSDGGYEMFQNFEFSIFFAPKSEQRLQKILSSYLGESKNRKTSDNFSLVAIRMKNKPKGTILDQSFKQAKLRQI